MVELWTTEEDQVILGMAELSKVLAVVTTTGTGRSASGYADMASHAASTSRARADQSISRAAAAPSPVGSSSRASR